MTTEKTHEQYLGDTLRDEDPDRYLLSLFTNKQRREALWALFLFNCEISKTRFVVTETQLGLIRLQWWRDEIGKLYEGDHAPEHPVLQGLEGALRDYGLPKALFDNLLFAREFDLEGVAPQGLDGLLNYADLTSTPLLKLALQITGDDPGEDSVQDVATRYALLQLFRRRAVYDANGFYLITQEMLDPLREYFIKKHRIKCDSIILKAQNALSDIYMKQLKSVQFDPNDPKLTRPPWFRELRVWMGSF